MENNTRYCDRFPEKAGREHLYKTLNKVINTFSLYLSNPNLFKEQPLLSKKAISYYKINLPLFKQYKLFYEEFTSYSNLFVFILRQLLDLKKQDKTFFKDFKFNRLNEKKEYYRKRMIECNKELRKMEESNIFDNLTNPDFCYFGESDIANRIFIWESGIPNVVLNCIKYSFYEPLEIKNINIDLIY